MSLRLFGTMLSFALILSGGVAQVALAQPPSGARAEGAMPGGMRVPELEEAIARLRAGDTEGGLAKIRAAVQKRPELSAPQVILAQWHASVNQTSAARAALEQAVIELPTDPEPYLILGEMALRGRQVTEAGLLFEKVNEMLKTSKDTSKRRMQLKQRAVVGLAAVAESRMNWKAAGDYLQELLTDDPKNALALQQLGRILFHQKKLEQALEKLREAVKINEELLTPEAELARLFQQAGDLPNSSKYMVAAIKANPRDYKTRLVAAQWSFETNSFENAEKQAEAALQLDPESLDAKYLRGTAALFLKKYDVAESWLQKAHLQSPSHLATITNLALALVEQKDETKRQLAQEYIELISRGYTDVSEVMSTRGWVLYRVGRLEEAELALRKAFSSGRPSPDSFYYFARLRVDRGHKEEARQMLEAALRLPGVFCWRQECEALLAQLKK